MKRAVVITGSGGGIGHALVRAFKDRGDFVVGIDKSHIDSSGADATLCLDIGELCSDENTADVLSRIEMALDGVPVHVLVNNAAVQLLGPFETLAPKDWRKTFDCNVIAPVLLTKLLLPQLAASNGSVINIASIHAKLTKPGFAAYATSKAALVAATRALALELGGRVRVNAISPAATATPMLLAGFVGAEKQFSRLANLHPAGRIAQPSEIANVAVFLASDAASFVTGANVEVDGGIGGCLLDPQPLLEE